MRPGAALPNCDTNLPKCHLRIRLQACLSPHSAHEPVYPVWPFPGRDLRPFTVQNGEPHESASWRRELLPVCPRCHKALAEVGREGRVLKATGERWHLGHTVGIFESRRAPKPR